MTPKMHNKTRSPIKGELESGSTKMTTEEFQAWQDNVLQTYLRVARLYTTSAVVSLPPMAILLSPEFVSGLAVAYVRLGKDEYTAIDFTCTKFFAENARRFRFCNGTYLDTWNLLPDGICNPGNDPRYSHLRGILNAAYTPRKQMAREEIRATLELLAFAMSDHLIPK